MEEIEIGDIVQITDDKHHWFPCLIVVDEVKSWGLQGFAFIPHNDEEATGQAYIRLKTDTFEKVGTAIIVPGLEEEDE